MDENLNLMFFGWCGSVPELRANQTSGQGAKSRIVKKSPTPAGTLSAPPELRAGRLDRVDRAQWLPTLVELLGVWLTAVAVNAVALI